MIRADDLTKRYGRQTAIESLSFEVGEGEIVGLLGPNGAGKSTTLKMLTGYLPPTSGAAWVGGYDVFRESVAARRQIGYLPENVPLYHDLRVREYLRFRGRLKGLGAGELRRRVREVCEECGLEEVRGRMIKVLSKGYRQRVGLADALLTAPPLLILDEPTNGLDPNQIRSIRELVRSLGQRHTILISSHILHEIEMICEKVMILDRGVLKAADTPGRLTAGLRTAGHIYFETRGPEEAVLRRLQGLPRVKKVLVRPPEGGDGGAEAGGWVRYQVLVDAGTDTRPRIAEVAAEEGWPVRTLHRYEPSLEDVFVELTRAQ